MKKQFEAFQKFLILAQKIDALKRFPELSLNERALIKHMNQYWYRNDNLTVIMAINLKDMSTATAFRNLKKLRQKGFIQLNFNDMDRRIKHVRPTEKLITLLEVYGRVMLKVAKDYLN